MADLSQCQMMMISRPTSWYRKSSMTSEDSQESAISERAKLQLSKAGRSGTSRLHSTWSETALISERQSGSGQKICSFASDLTIFFFFFFFSPANQRLVRSQQQVLRGEHTKPDITSGGCRQTVACQTSWTPSSTSVAQRTTVLLWTNSTDAWKIFNTRHGPLVLFEMQSSDYSTPLRVWR